MAIRRSFLGFNCVLRILICLDLLFIGILPAFAQRTNNQETHKYKIYKTTAVITVDGELSEYIWSTTDKFDDFWYGFPYDDHAVEAEYQTEVMMTYDDKYIYIAAICHGPGPYIIPSLKRDNG